jgi:hypothetical protein
MAIVNVIFVFINLRDSGEFGRRRLMGDEMLQSDGAAPVSYRLCKHGRIL